jgi:predicted CXXCH cytochrome family protein
MRTSVCRTRHANNSIMQYDKEGIRMMRRIIFLVTVTVLVLALTAGNALAYSDYVKIMSKRFSGPGNDSSAFIDGTTDGSYALGCLPCHGWDKQTVPNTSTVVNVQSVTSDLPGGTINNGAMNPGAPTPGVQTYFNLYANYSQPYGPHGGYTNTTDRCKVCHDVHESSGDKRLLPGSTVAEICSTCHDFTAGISIYGAIKAGTGVSPKGGHFIYGMSTSVEQTADTGKYIPGGDFVGAADVNAAMYPNTGGTVNYTSGGLISEDMRLTCTDCHTPHGNTSMRPFKGDRVRLGTGILVALCNLQSNTINHSQFDCTLAAGTTLQTVIKGGVGGTALTNAQDLQLAADSPAYIPGHVTSLGIGGTALAVSLIAAGVLDVSVEASASAHLGFTLRDAKLTRVASNKLLRDYIGGVANTDTAASGNISGVNPRGGLDLRQAMFGGSAPTTDAISYNENLAQYDPIVGLENGTPGAPDSVSATSAPWNNGQNGATAIYGSGFCYACHQGRLGNMLGGKGGVAIDPAFASHDTSSSYNHPTNMSLAYSNVGNLDSMGGTCGATDTVLGVWLTAAGVNRGDAPSLGHFPLLTGAFNGYQAAVRTGLALSNAGYCMAPVSAGTHEDGVISRGTTSSAAWAANQAGADAPICQQCHEDSRDLSKHFSYTDTDKNVPFGQPVNAAIGLGSAVVSATPIWKLAGGNPANPNFQNFPHETENARLIVESKMGGDSAAIGGAGMDGLCLNCHVPGSSLRWGDGKTKTITTVDGVTKAYAPTYVLDTRAGSPTLNHVTKIGYGFQE